MSNPSFAKGRSKILIVDDERLNINLLNALLKADYEIMVATRGEQALKVAASNPPDLILLDILMPELDGYEVCRRLKRNAVTSAIPVIFITALGEAEDETKGFDLGAVDFISKPFNFAVVRARVRTHMRLKLQSDLLETLALRDSLTGIPNRRAFDETREREWVRGQRSGEPLSLIMVDVDHFKQFNDFYGHGAGDECLVRVAQALSECARRPGDLVARYGGEEFAAILASTDHDGALMMGERLRLAVCDLAIPHTRSAAAPYVTVSVGVATTRPHVGATAEALTNVADRMLYQAKERGRNTIAGACIDEGSCSCPGGVRIEGRDG